MWQVSRRKALQAISASTLLSGVEALGLESAFLSHLSAGEKTPVPLGKPQEKQRTFRAPGKEFAEGIATFVEEFRVHKTKRIPFSISRLFDLFPFQVRDGSIAKALMARGSISFFDNNVRNTGDYVEGAFVDATYGEISVAFDENLEAIVSDTTERLYFDFNAKPVAVDLGSLSKKYQVSANQRLSSISFTKDLVRYTLHTATDATEEIQLDLDLTAARPDNPTLASLVPILMFADDKGNRGPWINCFCCVIGDAPDFKYGTQLKPYDYQADCIVKGTFSGGTAFTAYFRGLPFGLIDPNPNVHHWLLGKYVHVTQGSFGNCGLFGLANNSEHDASFQVNRIFTKVDINGNNYTMISNVENP